MPLNPDRVATLIRDSIGQKRQRKVSDGRNLYLVTRDGHASWVCQYWQADGNGGGLVRSHGLGPVPPTTPAMARKAHETFRVGLRNGTAPIKPRQRSAPVATSGRTFGTLAPQWLAKHADEWRPEQAKRNGAMLRLHAAALTDRPIESITVEQVADILRPIWTGPGNSTGSKVRGLIEKVFAMADVQPNPASWARLQNHLSNKTVASVSVASLPYVELPRLMKELARDPALAARAIRFLVFTGVRQKEAIGAKWGEIDFAAKILSVPSDRMKMKEAHIVPLSAAALDCLGPRGADDAYVFASRGSFIKPTVVWTCLNGYERKTSDGRPITTHGFRSTLATWAQDNSFATEVIDLVLAHKERSKTRAAYLRSDRLDERRKLADEWADFACAQVSP
jgi:integrase